MAWIKSTNGMWRDTGADDYATNAYMSDAQYQQWLGQQPGNNIFMATPTVTESGMIGDMSYANLANQGGDITMERPTTGSVYDAREYNDPQSSFWQNRYGADTPWRQVVSENPSLHALRNLAAAGYFNRFSDFDAASGQQLGQLIESMQNQESKSSQQNDVQAMSVLAGPFLAMAGGAASSAAGGGTTGAAAGGATVGGLYGGGAAALQGENVGKGALEGAVVGGVTGAAGGYANSQLGAETAASGSTGAWPSGGVSGNAGTEFNGGLNPNVTGSPGLNPNITGSQGLTSYDAQGTSLAPGYFPSESLAGPLSYGSSNSLLTQTGTKTPPPPTPQGGLEKLLSNPSLLGAAGGALLGGMGGGGKAGTVQTEEGLPDWLMPYAKPALDQYSSQIQNLNTDPYGIMPSAMKEFKSTIDGQYLDPSTNKYLEDYYKLGAERIKGSLSPSFGHMQAFGSHTGYNEALSRGLGDFATGLYGGNYAKERDRQTSMTASAPQFLAQSSTAQTLPYQQYLQSLSGLGKKKEDPYFTNPMGGILGGAMMGSQMGSLWS